MTRSLRALTIVGIVLATGTVAHAQTTLASFSYDSLSGSYVAGTPTSGVFSANAVDQPLLRTVGNFDRTIASVGNADFPAGFVNDANPANIQLSLPVAVTSGTTASTVAGQISITDIDGDVFNAVIDGDWYLLGPGFTFFNGNLTNISFVDNGAADGTFDGYSGSWVMNLPGNPLEGAIVNLVFGGTNWFVQDFNDFAVGVSGQVIPTPGAMALLGMGGLLAARRRR